VRFDQDRLVNPVVKLNISTFFAKLNKTGQPVSKHMEHELCGEFFADLVVG
jgi:hypothetical protein